MLPLTIFKYSMKLVIMEIFCVFLQLHLLALEASFMELKMGLEWLITSLFLTKVAVLP